MLKIYPITPLTSQLVLEARLRPGFKSGPSTLVYSSVRTEALFVLHHIDNGRTTMNHSWYSAVVLPNLYMIIILVVATEAEVASKKSME